MEEELLGGGRGPCPWATGHLPLTTRGGSWSAHPPPRELHTRSASDRLRGGGAPGPSVSFLFRRVCCRHCSRHHTGRAKRKVRAPASGWVGPEPGRCKTNRCVLSPQRKGPGVPRADAAGRGRPPKTPELAAAGGQGSRCWGFRGSNGPDGAACLPACLPVRPVSEGRGASHGESPAGLSPPGPPPQALPAPFFSVAPAPVAALAWSFPARCSPCDPTGPSAEGGDPLGLPRPSPELAPAPQGAATTRARALGPRANTPSWLCSRGATGLQGLCVSDRLVLAAGTRQHWPEQRSVLSLSPRRRRASWALQASLPAGHPLSSAGVCVSPLPIRTAVSVGWGPSQRPH